MPYLGYLLAQAVKAGNTIKDAISSAASFVTKVGGSVVDLSPSVEPLKSPSDGSAYINDGVDTTISAINGSDMTVCCWVYFDADNSVIRTVWASQENAGHGYQFLQRYAATTTFRSMWGTGSSGTSYVFSSAGTAIDNKWIHVACVHTSSKNYIYVNGELDGEANAGTTVGASSTYKIGAYGSINSYSLYGNVANWGMWQRALSAEEIRSVMNKSYDELSASETKGLLSWHALDSLENNVSIDSHGNYNGTY